MKKIEGKYNKKLIAEKGKLLHRKGGSSYNHVIVVTLEDDLSDIEEVDESQVPQEPSADYDQEVSRLIRERYSLDQELAILRQRDSKPEEFAAYNQYAEDCKAFVKSKL